MNIAFIIYDEMTVLDFVGVFDPVTRLRTMGFRDDITWEICATMPEVTGTGGITINATSVDEPLYDYDMIIIPGTTETESYVNNQEFIDWLRTASETRLKVSVCTGALLLGEAGFLEGHKATTHPMAYDTLKEYATLSEDRIVHDGNIITSRGVTAAIDLGLYLCEELAGAEVRKEIKEQMDYPY